MSVCKADLVSAHFHTQKEKSMIGLAIRRKTNATTMSLYCSTTRDRWLLWLQCKPIIDFLLAGCIFMKSNARMFKHFWYKKTEFLRAPLPAAETGGILGNRWPSVSNEHVLREWSNHLLFQCTLSNNLILLAVNRHIEHLSYKPYKWVFLHYLTQIKAFTCVSFLKQNNVWKGIRRAMVIYANADGKLLANCPSCVN